MNMNMEKEMDEAVVEDEVRKHRLVATIIKCAHQMCVAGVHPNNRSLCCLFPIWPSLFQVMPSN